MAFVTPVHVGELLTLSASVNAVWRTSMEIGVRVEAENPRTGERRHTELRLPDDGRRRRGGHRPGPAADHRDRRAAPARGRGPGAATQPACGARRDHRAAEAELPRADRSPSSLPRPCLRFRRRAGGPVSVFVPHCALEQSKYGACYPDEARFVAAPRRESTAPHSSPASAEAHAARTRARRCRPARAAPRWTSTRLTAAATASSRWSTRATGTTRSTATDTLTAAPATTS